MQCYLSWPRMLTLKEFAYFIQISPGLYSFVWVDVYYVCLFKGVVAATELNTEEGEIAQRVHIFAYWRFAVPSLSEHFGMWLPPPPPPSPAHTSRKQKFYMCLSYIWQCKGYSLWCLGDHVLWYQGINEASYIKRHAFNLLSYFSSTGLLFQIKSTFNMVQSDSAMVRAFALHAVPSTTKNYS